MRYSRKSRSSSPQSRHVSVPKKSKQRIEQLPAEDWTVADVAAWLGTLQLTKYAGIFERNCVDGTLLLELDTETLGSELRIADVADCEKIAQAIGTLERPAKSATAHTRRPGGLECQHPAMCSNLHHVHHCITEHHMQAR